MSEVEQENAKQTLGDAWVAMGNRNGEESSFLAQAISTVLADKNAELKQTPDGEYVGIISSTKPVGALALLKIENTKNRLHSFYPYFNDGKMVFITIGAVHPWDSGVEGIIEGTVTVSISASLTGCSF